ncbi:hypothetical protein Tco_0569384 [Tanacetum coccineum]
MSMKYGCWSSSHTGHNGLNIVLIIERPRGVYKGWDSKIPNLLGSPAHAPSKGGRDSRVSRESTTGIGCSDKQPSRSSRHRTTNIRELQLQLSAFKHFQWGLTPTSVNSAHAPSKGGRDSWVSRDSTTRIGCSDKQPSWSSRHQTANIWELQSQLSASIYGRDHLLYADRSPKLLFSTLRKHDQSNWYANVSSKPSRTKVNFRILFTPAGNGIDLVVPVESIRAISERFANTAYGFFLVTKIKESTFYEFKLANKKCQFDVEVFCKALDMCPRVQGKEFIVPPSEEELLTFLIDFLYQIDNSQLKKGRRENMPYLRFTTSGDDTDISPSYDTEPMVEMPYTAEYNVLAVDTQHSEQSESIINTCVVETECEDERVALANLIANLKLDIDENKKVQNRALGESNSVRDSCLVALQNKQTEFERYKAFNVRTVDYDKLERKLNETLGLLDQKEIDIKEGLKLKAYEISVVKEKHDELVKQSLLTKSHYEGLVKEKTKVITDLKLKEEKDIDKMKSMENLLKFLNEIVYKRSQSIQTIHMLAPKCPTFNGRPTFANPKYLKKAQSEIPCLYEIPHDQSDPANKLVPDREETRTLERESQSKLNKDLVKPYDYTKLNINTSSTDSQMHNNIMAAGSKERPPMLGPGRYSQWHSRFLRYLDTKSNGEYLRKCIFDGPYLPTNVLIAAVEAAENILPVAAHEEVETIHNMTAENKLYFQAEKEAIFLILTGIGDEIYSTVDACNTAKEMWTAIERLQQGESLNVQDVKTNLFWEFGKFTSRDGESMESYYSRFYKLMNELTRNNLQVSPMQVNVQFLQQLQPEWSRFVTVVKQRQEIDTVSYHKLFDVLKQFQNEVNDIRSERLARSANPLALLAAAQPYSDNYYQAPKPQRSNAPSYKQSSSTRSTATTRHKGKEIAKPVTPQSESVSEEDSDPEQARRDKDMQKNLALLAKYFKKLYKPTNNNLRTSSNSTNKTEDTTPRYNNDNQSRQFGNQRTMTVAGARETEQKPKRAKDYAYHKEKMMMCKQAEQGVPLQAEQADWLEDTDEEIDEQELEAHYSYMAKIQEVSPEESSSTSQPLEQVQNHDENDVFANVRRHSEQPESINDTYVLEKDDSNVIPDSSNICTNDNPIDQNATACVDERAALANFISNLTP